MNKSTFAKYTISVLNAKCSRSIVRVLIPSEPFPIKSPCRKIGMHLRGKFRISTTQRHILLLAIKTIQNKEKGQAILNHNKWIILHKFMNNLLSREKNINLKETTNILNSIALLVRDNILTIRILPALLKTEATTTIYPKLEEVSQLLIVTSKTPLIFTTTIWWKNTEGMHRNFQVIVTQMIRYAMLCPINCKGICDRGLRLIGRKL